MAKWKCEICNSEFENFQAQGFNHKIYCPLCYYKKLYTDAELEIERLRKGYCELKVKCNNGECDCTNEEYDGMAESNMKLSLEIDRLKELCNKYEEEHNNEFQCWKRDRKELLDKRARIDKAIEYIKENQYRLDLDRIKNELLEILGDDNE